MPYPFSYQSPRRYYTPRYNTRRYVRGQGDYYIPGRSYMRGRGDYRKVWAGLRKMTSAWSAPKIGGAIGRFAGTMAKPMVSEYLGPAIAEAAPSVGESMGKMGGSLFKRVTGMGDYTVHSNSILFPDKLVPQFGEDSIRVKKRELIAIIDAYSSFTNLAIPIQPGLDTSFPWLSKIAANYEQYRFNGLIYQYVSTTSDAIASTTNLALGTVGMATDYDANDPAFVNLPQMLGSMYSNSGKPSENIMHAIECDPKQQAQKLYYVRTGDAPSNSDLRLYDLGLFQLAWQGPAAYTDAGQLWVTYDVTFTKSVQNNQLGFDLNTDKYSLVAPAVAAAFGTSRTLDEGSNLGTTVSNTVISFPPTLSSGYYMITYQAIGASTAVNAPTWTGANCTLVTGIWNNNADNNITNSGTTSTKYFQVGVWRIDGNNATITSSGGTLPSSPTYGDLVIQQVNGELFL